MPVTFEVYAYKNGNWNIDSVYDDKDMSVYEARLLLDSRHVKAVRVIEENYDESSGESMSKVVFKAQKGQERSKPKPAPKPEPKQGPPVRNDAKPAPKKEDKLIRYVVLLVLSIGGIGLGILALIFFLIEAFD